MMIDPQQAQELIVEVCQKVILNLAQQSKIAPDNLNVRIDLQNPTAIPVFALYDKQQFYERKTLKEIIAAGAEDIPAMFRNQLIVPVKDVIASIFTSAMVRFQSTSTQELFVLLYTVNDTPNMALYKNHRRMESAPVAQLIGVGENNTSQDG